MDQRFSWTSTPDDSAPLSSQSSISRVCDRCMVKKIKCNQKRPTCSRCLEGGNNCVYSTKRKKPGPARGSRRKPSSSRTALGSNSRSFESSLEQNSADSPIGQLSLELPSKSLSTCTTDNSIDLQQSASLEQFNIPQGTLQPGISTVGFLPDTPNSWQSVQPTSSLGQESNYRSPAEPHLEPEQERQLLEEFFNLVQSSITLFSKEKFFQQYQNGLVGRDLLLTILAISANILGLESLSNTSGLDNFLNYVLEVNILDDGNLSPLKPLDKFRQACLLAYFSFHQYPGKRSWMRISQLTRSAYEFGLHQIDNENEPRQFDCNCATADEAEEWRYVWWCIYCLDSYCNTTAATPFVVELESVRTALIGTCTREVSQKTTSNHPSASPMKIFLPAETESLWKTTKAVTAGGGDINFNIHIVTTTILREVATLRRLRLQNPSERLRNRATVLGDHLASIRLALPPRFLNYSRNVLHNESSSAHNARLVCILHLHASRLILPMPGESPGTEAGWTDRWQQILECCEDIVLVVKQWDGQYSSTVDPAVCFIISAALMLLHLQCKRSLSLATELEERIEAYKNTLLLFLEQFASFWYLPRFMIMSFNKFSEILPEPLTPEDVERVLRLSLGPMHQNWLNFVSLEPDSRNISASQAAGDSISSNEWIFGDLDSFLFDGEISGSILEAG